MDILCGVKGAGEFLGICFEVSLEHRIWIELEAARIFADEPFRVDQAWQLIDLIGFNALEIHFADLRPVSN